MQVGLAGLLVLLFAVAAFGAVLGFGWAFVIRALARHRPEEQVGRALRRADAPRRGYGGR